MTNEEAIKNIVAYIYYDEDIPEALGKAFDLAIKALEERPQGEWIIGVGDMVICPFCKERHCCKMNFCGNCGADMRGGAE